MEGGVGGVCRRSKEEGVWETRIAEDFRRGEGVERCRRCWAELSFVLGLIEGGGLRRRLDWEEGSCLAVMVLGVEEEDDGLLEFEEGGRR